MSHEQLPHIRTPGRVLVKGNIVWFAPQGIPFNVTCKHNAIAFIPADQEVLPTDTVIEGDLVLQGQLYCEDLGERSGT